MLVRIFLGFQALLFQLFQARMGLGSRRLHAITPSLILRIVRRSRSRAMPEYTTLFF